MQRPDSKHPNTNQLTEVGQIASAHGIRGQVKLRSFTADPDAIFDYSPVTDKKGKPYLLTREGYKEQLFIVSIKGVTDRNAAELLKGTVLYAAISQEVEKAENEWLYSELKGLEARLESGKTYGTVVSVDNFGAGDIIEIEHKDGSTEMLPFKPAFIGDIEVEKGYLVIFPPEYMEGEDRE
jgi:16S rRNA processing protein RimM